MEVPIVRDQDRKLFEHRWHLSTLTASESGGEGLPVGVEAFDLVGDPEDAFDRGCLRIQLSHERPLLPFLVEEGRCHGCGQRRDGQYRKEPGTPTQAAGAGLDDRQPTKFGGRAGLEGHEVGPNPFDLKGCQSGPDGLARDDQQVDAKLSDPCPADRAGNVHVVRPERRDAPDLRIDDLIQALARGFGHGKRGFDRLRPRKDKCDCRAPGALGQPTRPLTHRDGLARRRIGQPQAAGTRISIGTEDARADAKGMTNPFRQAGAKRPSPVCEA